MAADQHGQGTLRAGAMNVLTCILTILVAPFFFVAIILFAGPVIYYRTRIVKVSALTERYETEGVRLDARVAKRWIYRQGGRNPTTSYYVTVAYRWQSVVYTKQFSVSSFAYNQRTLEVILLPDYPKSAVLYASIHNRDEMDQQDYVHGIVFGFLWTTIWNIVPTSIILSGIDGCSFCNYLIAPIFFGLVTLEFSVGYWLARKERDVQVQSTLYGGKEHPLDTQHTSTPDPDPKTTYRDLFGDDPLSCCMVLGKILKDLGCLLLGILAFPYFLIFGGGFMLLHFTVFARKRHKLLEEYAAQGVAVTGKVMRRPQGEVKVVYEFDHEKYQKQLDVPKYRVQRNGCCGGQLQYENVINEPELVVLRLYPSSAQLKTRIDNRLKELDEASRSAGVSLILTMLQVAYFLVMSHAIISLGESEAGNNDTGLRFMAVIGIYIAAQVLLGFAVAFVFYRFFFVPNLLHRAEKLSQVQYHDPEDSILDTEMVAGLEEFGNLTETTASTSDADSFVSKFMAGRFPRMDRAFS